MGATGSMLASARATEQRIYRGAFAIMSKRHLQALPERAVTSSAERRWLARQWLGQWG
jgi:hypothetical protein